MKKKLSCTLKVNTMEKHFVFPKLKAYCMENKIRCTIDRKGVDRYELSATARPSVIDACAKMLMDWQVKFPGKILDVIAVDVPKA